MQSGKSHRSSSALCSLDFEIQTLRNMQVSHCGRSKTTAPGIAPLSTSDWKVSVTRLNRSEEKPTSSGLFALESPCANDENAMHVAIADMQMWPNLIDTSRLLAKSDCVQEIAVRSRKAQRLKDLPRRTDRQSASANEIMIRRPIPPRWLV
jgi:hypothetical protein